jgi:hypothetical protein
MLYVHLRLQGELEEHEKIVSALGEVDIVISALAYPQVLDQLKIIEAIKVAGNIKVTNTLSITLFSSVISLVVGCIRFMLTNSALKNNLV